MKTSVFWAELMGTFALVFAGTGAIVVDSVTHGAVTHVGVALTFGLVVLAMIYTVGEVSGAHLNPAVTLGFVVAGRLPAERAGVYMLAQLIGALLASVALRWIFPESSTLGATVPAGPAGQSFALEFLLTFFLMQAILNVSRGAQEKGITAGIVVGSVIALEALFAGPISGASMNPFRSLAPALLEGELGSVWIYLLAPVLGAVAASPVCRLIHGPNCCGLAR
ncbi:MAG: aquaporin [Candidatus Eremiobacterota bacterium]